MKIISGQWRGVSLSTAPGQRFRPTQGRIREALFSRLGGHVAGAVVVDLYAGSGALALEALSRGAQRAILVEQSGEALRVLRRNIQAVEASDVTQVVAGDVGDFLDGHYGTIDNVRILLADPPYGQMDGGFARRVARSPGLRWSEGALMAIETSARQPRPLPVPGWQLWPGGEHGETRVTIMERGLEDADAV